MKNKPNPGSHKAGEMGCKCPVMDNGHGNGAWGGVKINGHKVFIYNERCPLHREEYDKGLRSD